MLYSLLNKNIINSYKKIFAKRSSAEQQVFKMANFQAWTGLRALAAYPGIVDEKKRKIKLFEELCRRKNPEILAKLNIKPNTKILYWAAEP